MFAQELTEIALAEHGELAVVECGDVGGARLPADQRHLAEDIARPSLILRPATETSTCPFEMKYTRVGFVAGADNALTRLRRLRLEVQHQHLALLGVILAKSGKRCGSSCGVKVFAPRLAARHVAGRVQVGLQHGEARAALLLEAPR